MLSLRHKESCGIWEQNPFGLADRTLHLPRLSVLGETLAPYSISQIALNISITLRYLLQGSCTAVLHCHHHLLFSHTEQLSDAVSTFLRKCEAARRNVAKNSMWKEI